MNTDSPTSIHRARYAPVPGTAHASSERADFETIREECEKLRETGPMLEIFSNLPLPILIINSTRQAVFANTAMLAISGDSLSDVIGLRLGEILRCRYSVSHLGGCGTSTPCRTCGVTNAVLAALGGRLDSAQCHVRASECESFIESRFFVHAIPFMFRDDPFTALFIEGYEAVTG